MRFIKQMLRLRCIKLLGDFSFEHMNSNNLKFYMLLLFLAKNIMHCKMENAYNGLCLNSISFQWIYKNRIKRFARLLFIASVQITNHF